MKTFTLDELKHANGQNERPIHVCVNGKIYDITDSPLWTDGEHMNRHHAGADLSEEIKDAPHDLSVLEHYEQVGILHPDSDLDSGSDTTKSQKTAESEDIVKATDKSIKSTTGKTIESPRTPTLLKPLMRLHPHPVSVHFPIALTIISAILIVAGHLLPSFAVKLHTAAKVDLVLAALFTVPAIATGFLSHYYNYGNKWTAIFKIKLILSAIFSSVFLITLLLLFVIVESDFISSSMQIFFATLVFILAVNVMGLGYFGGRITFPTGRR